MAAAVGEVPGAAEVRQVGYDVSVLYFDGIVVDMPGAPSEGDHPVDIHFEVAVFDAIADHLRFALEAGQTVFAALVQDAAALEKEGRRH